MAKLLDPNFASQPCDRFDWWLVESNTDISGLFSTRKQKKEHFLFEKKGVAKKRLSLGPQIPMSLMRIDGHSDLHQYQRQKYQKQRNQQNKSIGGAHMKSNRKKKDYDRLQGHNDRGSHVGSKCWSSRSNKLIRWAWALSISISIFNNIVVYQHRNKFLAAQYLCEEEEEQTDGQDRTCASISEQVVIYLPCKHLTFITEKTIRQKNEKLSATKWSH